MGCILMASDTIEVDVVGRGPNLVLLHSLLADRSSFAGIVGQLAERFCVIVPALPGFGGSAVVEGGLAATAGRVAELVERFAGDGPVRLLGNGYGGFVALRMVIDHPRLVSRLVLADAGACFSEPGRAAFAGMAKAAATKGLDAIADIAMRRLFAPDFHAANPAMVASRKEIFLRSDPGVIIRACEALASMDLRGDLASVGLPVLAVVGAQDEATPPAMSEELVALLSDARLCVLDGLAHVPQLQAPERFLAAVLPFLNEG